MPRPKLNRRKQYITLDDEAYSVLRQAAEKTGETMGRLIDVAILETFGPENEIQKTLDTFKVQLRDEMILLITNRDRTQALDCGLSLEEVNRLFPLETV